MTESWAERAELTAILITVPELAAYTDRWRTASSSSARPGLTLAELIPPHVTVLVPWVAAPGPDDLRRLKDAVAGFEPFEVSFPTAVGFPNGTVWLRPEPFEEVRGLLRTVLTAFPDYPPYGGDHPDPHPHLTISSGDSSVLAEVEAALLASPPPAVRIAELTLWREGPDLIWQQIGSVPLGQAG